MNARTIAGVLAAGTLAVLAEPFEARVMHPGFDHQEARVQPVFQTWDNSGYIKEYHSDVDSVICAAGQCEIITVRLFWNAHGQFLRYAFPQGGNLTKKNHQPFSRRDHTKLLSILQNEDSSLADIDPKDIVSPAEALLAGDADVDAISSATLLSDTSSYVEGAVYTSYTLWHWTQGDMKEAIRSITGETIGKEQLMALLTGGDPDGSAYAIEQFAKQNIAEPAVVNAIRQRAREGSQELAGSAIEYFQSQGAEVYYAAMADLFPESSSRKQVLYLSSLASTDLNAPPGFYTDLSAQLPKLDSYYEVHLLLNLLSQHDVHSIQVVSNTVSLLDHQSFFIARRAYHFLKDHELPENQKAELEAFRSKYEDRL